jgi:hypothetical protein
VPSPISITNKDFIVYLRQYLAAIEGTLTREQAEHIDTLCRLVRGSGTAWARGIGSTRIVEIDLLNSYLLAGYDPETMTAEIRTSQANVQWYDGQSEDDVREAVIELVARKISEFDARDGFERRMQRDARLDVSARLLRARLQQSARPGPTRGSATMPPARLRLVAANRLFVEDPDFRADRADAPIETIIVRDDLGRKLEVAGLAFGKVAPDLGLFNVEGIAVADDIVVSGASLDAGKTYLVVVVEHSDDIDTEE